MWSSDGYWLKAKSYIEKANEYGQDRWEHPFWCSLSLELLARAALTKVHPVLNADPQNEGIHIMYALGIQLKGQPKSIPIHSVIGRLEKIIEGFEKPQKTFCDYFFIIRNQELHTGELSCEALNPAKWQAKFYETCKILCDFLGKSLNEFLGDELVEAAMQMIEAAKSKKLGKVKKNINDHKAVFEEKDPEEQEKLKQESEIRRVEWKHEFTSKECPACNSYARLGGEFVRESPPVYRDDILYVDRLYIANRLECNVCGLVLDDMEEILMADVDPSFSERVSTSLHELYEPEYEFEYENM